MAKPRVFVSSTFYDLRHIRTSLDLFIEGLGFESVLSEKGDIAYAVEQPLDESCYAEVRTVDIFVLIVGGRYGSPASDQSAAVDSDAEALGRYESITKREFQTAVERDIPIYILIDSAVYAEYQTYKRNREVSGISYAHVDDVGVFRLIDEILALPRNNPVHTFERFNDIEEWLRAQWAGSFRDLLQRRSEQRQLRDLGSQVSELREIGETLKTYLESVVSSVNPESSAALIEAESSRLRSQRVLRELEDGTALLSYLRRLENGFTAEGLADSLAGSKTFTEWIRNLRELNPEVAQNLSFLSDDDSFQDDVNTSRRILGLPPFRFAKKKDG